MPNKIPKEVKSFKEGSAKEQKYLSDAPAIYEPIKGEVIDVYLWIRYPSYDFIFGVPNKANPNYKKELGFFQYRDSRTRTVLVGMYIDRQELDEMVEGFSRLRDVSKDTRPDMWNK